MIYNLLLLIRGTRAVQMLGGIVFVGLIYFMPSRGAADAPGHPRKPQIVLPFAIIVLFQQEIAGRSPTSGAIRSGG